MNTKQYYSTLASMNYRPPKPRLLAPTLPRVDEPWWTVDEIAQRLKISEFTVRGWLRQKRLRGVNFGGKTGWRVKDSDLRAFLERRGAQDDEKGPQP